MRTRSVTIVTHTLRGDALKVQSETVQQVRTPFVVNPALTYPNLLRFGAGIASARRQGLEP